MAPVTPFLVWVSMTFTGSMYPTFKGGEVRAVIHKPYSEIAPGEIVLRKTAFNIVCHRAKVKRLGRWITQGDANKFPDPGYMNEETYLGEVNAN